jgi:hypothetical protein
MSFDHEVYAAGKDERAEDPGQDRTRPKPVVAAALLVALVSVGAGAARFALDGHVNVSAQ